MQMIFSACALLCDKGEAQQNTVQRWKDVAAKSKLDSGSRSRLVLNLGGRGKASRSSNLLAGAGSAEVVLSTPQALSVKLKELAERVRREVNVGSHKHGDILGSNKYY